jgi:hypothetical protein
MRYACIEAATMMLGDVLAQLNDEGGAAEIILGVGDLCLLAAMRRRAETEGLDLAAYARAAVQRYAAEASDEEWITLMGLMGCTGDPGTACLKRVFERLGL